MEQINEIITWINQYIASRLALKRETTRETYTIILRQFLLWLREQPGHAAPFTPSADLTQTAVQTYLLVALRDTSISHRERTKSILSSFAEWLIDEGHLVRNPTRGLSFPAQQLLVVNDLKYGHFLPSKRHFCPQL